MTMYIATIYTLEKGKIIDYEDISIEAHSKESAWERALFIAFDNLFASKKMVYIIEEAMF